MLKKAKSIVVTLGLVTTLVTVPVLQAEAATHLNEKSTVYNEVMPIMEYINSVDCLFSVKDQTASVMAFVTGHSSATKSRIVVELQEKSGNSWKTIKTWRDTQNGYRAEIDGSKKVTKGKSYRVVTTATVWKGSDSETRKMTSKVKTA